MIEFIDKEEEERKRRRRGRVKPDSLGQIGEGTENAIENDSGNSNGNGTGNAPAIEANPLTYDIEGTRLFECANYVVNAVVPDGITSIEDGAFAGCSILQSVKIPDSVTHIATFAFASCNSLKSIKIPASVKKIDQNAFFWCRKDMIIYVSFLHFNRIPDENKARSAIYNLKNPLPDQTTLDRNGYLRFLVLELKESEWDTESEILKIIIENDFADVLKMILEKVGKDVPNYEKVIDYARDKEAVTCMGELLDWKNRNGLFDFNFD